MENTETNIQNIAYDLTKKEAEHQRKVRDGMFDFSIRYLFWCKEFSQAARCVLSGDLFGEKDTFYTHDPKDFNQAGMF